MKNKKILWKIEELWKKYYVNHRVVHGSERESSIVKSILNLYKNNISIYSTDFQIVEKFNFKKTNNITHKDDYGEYFGLKKSQVLEKSGKLIYLFDNHNKILQSFLEYFESTKKSFDVVHVDAHDDNSLFKGEKINKLSIKDIGGYIGQTSISNFFDYVFSTGLINNVHRYTKSSDFKNFKKPKNPYILSLDIDIFGLEGCFVDIESKIKIIAEAWKYADVICIAMSPGFIDQKYAQNIVKVFVGD